MTRRVSALAALLLLAGCGNTAFPGPRAPAGPPVIGAAWTSCAEEVDEQSRMGGAEPLSLPRLPPGFEPVTVIVCAVDRQVRSDGGEDQVLVERHGTDVAALTAALRLPDEPLTDGACTMDLPGVPWFAVVDGQGRWLRPGVARDTCGKLRIEVREAVGKAALTVKATTVLRETVSAETAKSGCVQQWADMVAVVASDPVKPSPRMIEPPASAVRLCVYAVPASEQGSVKPAGTFERGGPLPEPRWSQLRTLIVASAAAPAPCTAHASRFALLITDPPTGEIYVELDGCRRLLQTPPQGGASLRQASTELITALNS